MDALGESPKPTTDFTIIFRKSPDYKLYPAPVIYGGLIPDGSGILMNACIDHFAFPNLTMHETDANGMVNLSQAKSRVVQGEVEREILCGIYLTIDQAIGLREWLDNHIKKVR